MSSVLISADQFDRYLAMEAIVDAARLTVEHIPFCDDHGLAAAIEDLDSVSTRQTVTFEDVRETLEGKATVDTRQEPGCICDTDDIEVCPVHCQ